MSRMSKKRRNVLIATAVGIALLVASGSVLWNILPTTGIAEGLGIAPPEYLPPEEIPIALAQPSLSGVSVSIIEEPENAMMVIEGFYANEVGRWRQWLSDAGARLTNPGEADVLIIPLGECLGAPARGIIEKHLSEGGGIVTTGLFGARNATCTAVPDTLLVNLLGLPAGQRSVARPDTSTAHLVLLGETMLAAGAPAGARLDLEPVQHLVFRGQERELFFASFGRLPHAIDNVPFFDGAVARATVGNGRVVAFGFGIAELTGTWSEGVGRIIVRNAVDWAAGNPVLQLATWPEGYAAAAVVAQDVEADYANASQANEIVEAAGIPTTYFIVGQLAQTNPFVTRALAATGELASHSYHHRPMDSYSDEGQREELAMGKSSAEEFSSGAAVTGFRPPEERFTVETLRAWAEIGGDYFFASDQGRSAVPVIVPFGPDSLVFLGRVIDDDYSLLSRNEMRDRSEMVRSLVDQIDEVVAYRGAYLFDYHSHIMAQEQLLPVLSELVKALQARSDLWLATAGEVAQWWRARNAIEIARNDVGTGATVRNGGEHLYTNGVLIVDLPDGSQKRVAIPELAPGDSVELNW